jgi:hypothetical protein
MSLGGGSPPGGSRPRRPQPGTTGPKDPMTPPATTLKTMDLRRSPATQADSDPRS